MPLWNFLFQVRRPAPARMIAAALIAPPIGVFLWGLILPIFESRLTWELNGMPLTPSALIGLATLAVGFAAIPAYAGTLLIGVPTMAVLRWLPAETGAAYLSVATVAGVTAVFVLSGGELLPIAERMALALPGLFVAATWWLIVFPGAETPARRSTD